MAITDLYNAEFMDHVAHPDYKYEMEDPTCSHEGVNPSCGDELTLRVHLDGDTITDISYAAEGCSISQASTSVMGDLLIGGTTAHALELHDKFLEMMQSQGRIEPDEDTFEDAIAFAGVSKFPARVKCALLGWSALRDATLQATAKED